uniref:Chromo domain-containing protein n=1 Tax=Onchocerca volvulus TaxID=6282 RepID=A0A2K6VVQ9_ONCVO
MNEINKNETKNEDICEDGDEDEELDDDEFEVDHILNVAVMDGEVKYQVRWKGYGSDEDSWEPEENLKTAQLILDEYIANHQNEMKKVDAILSRKLRKQCGKRIKLRIKGNRKSRRISGTGYSEVLNSRAKKRMKLYEDNLMSNSDKDSDEDYEEVSKKHGRTANTKPKTTKIAISSKNKRSKSLTKELSPKKAKNAWLYEDAEDADSDASEGSEMAKKSDAFLRKAKKNNQLKENGAIEKSNASLAEAEEQYENNSIEKIAILLNEKEQKEKEASTKVDLMKGNYEPKVEFTGVVQCPDGAVKVVYLEKDGTRAHVVSVREAFEIDGYGLVQYFISRCEFGEPQSNDI